MKLSQPFSLLLTALGGGLLWAFQFGRETYFWLPWIALVPTIFLIVGFDLKPKQAALWGWLSGFVVWAVSIPWIAPTLEVFGKLPSAVAWLLFGALAAYLGLYQAVFCGLGRLFFLRSPSLGLVASPSLWVVLEIVRGWMIGGFPWNLAAYAAIDSPGVRTLAPWTGPWGMSAILVLVNGLLAYGLWTRQKRVLLLVIPVMILFGAASQAKSPTGETGPRVHIIQPNTPNLVEFDAQLAWANYHRLISLSHAACDEEAALLLWPESATWPFRFPQAESLKNDLKELAQRGCPIVFNTPYQVGDQFFNSVFFYETESLNRYDKRHLVPFGEYVPLGDVISWVSTLAREAGNFAASSEVRLLPWGDEKLGTAICFEVTFPAEVAALVQQGATILVTVTNDAWYGDSWAPWQHLRAARFRAAESRRPMVRAAITGVSAAINSHGEVEQSLGVFEEGWLTATLHPNLKLTFFSRYPRLIPRLCLVIVFFSSLLCWRNKR